MVNVPPGTRVLKLLDLETPQEPQGMLTEGEQEEEEAEDEEAE
jgi:hypothetical protein